MLGNLIIARKGDSDAANVPQFILSGLLPNPIPTPSGSSNSALLYLNIPVTLITGAESGFESNVYAVPYRGTRFSWQISGDIVTDVALLGSEDGVNYYPLDTATSAGIQTFRANVAFIQVSVVDGLDVNVTVNIKGKKFR